MRILITSPNIPSRDGEAVHVVLNEALEAIRLMGHDVALQPVFSTRAALSDQEKRRVRELAERGVSVCDPLFAAGAQSRNGTRRSVLPRARRMLFPTVSDHYPTVTLRDRLHERVEQTRSDAVLVFWDPDGLAATYGLKGIKKAAYYGMPDYMAGEARFADPELFGIPHQTLMETIRLRAARRLIAQRKAYHFDLINDCDAVGNICAFHATLYREQGHPHSYYIPNMWPDTPHAAWREEREAAERTSSLKMLGTLGDAVATGNTYGLYYMGKEILPRLDRRLGNTFEVHLYGKGEPYPLVARALEHPSVRRRGWVQDLDAEILSCKVFLMMNNTGTYKGSHTRFFHAWSLGSCVVAHKINAQAIPEIRHMENALLGETPEEITELIVMALRDERLRRRIGEGGRQTYEASFKPAVVVPHLLERLLGHGAGQSNALHAGKGGEV